MSNLDNVRAELAGFIRAMSAYRLLAHRAATEHLGLSLTDLRCLDAVRTIPDLTPGQLAAIIGLSPSATTTALDRLEQRGLVERTRDSVDRRRVHLTSTGRHEKETSHLFEPLTDAAQELLSDYSETQLALFAGLLRDLSAVSNALVQQQAQAGPT